MSILSKEEFMNYLKEKVGESTEDNDIKFLEDMTDTYNDLEMKSNNEELSKTKQELADLKVRYHDRFFSGTTTVEDTDPLKPAEDVEEYDFSFNKLFKEGK